jgi:pyridoxal phosphate enzyme (YggS family)
MSIAQKIKYFQNILANTGCRLVAVSKTQPVEALLEAYQAGQRLFGENKVQEMMAKQEALPANIEWHLIGHLQTNKVKYIAPFVHTIQSVDSLKLLQEIEKQAAKYERTILCLLQIYIADEETKFGLSPAEAIEILQSEAYKAMQHIEITGVMGIATNTVAVEQLRKEFRQLRYCFEQLKIHFFADKPAFKEISMGMSGDYEIALAEGSTLIRVGSSIFGARTYSN